MTGRLHNLTAPEWLGDHKRRIEALERRLNTGQTDPGARLHPRFGGSLFHVRGPNASGLQTFTPSPSDQTIQYENVIRTSTHVAAVTGQPGVYEVQPGLYVVTLNLQWQVVPASSGQVKAGISIPGGGSNAAVFSQLDPPSSEYWSLTVPIAITAADWVYGYVVFNGPSAATLNRQIGGLRILRTGPLP